MQPSPSPQASPEGDGFEVLPAEVVPDTVADIDEADWGHILEEIYAFRAYLFEHPTADEHLELI